MIAEESEGRFKETDFSVYLRNEETEHVLEVTYRYEPRYSLIARMTLSEDAIQGEVYFFLTVSPGDMFMKEAAKYVKPKELEDYIKAWLQRLDDELSSVPIQRQLEEQRQEIERTNPRRRRNTEVTRLEILSDGTEATTTASAPCG